MAISHQPPEYTRCSDVVMCWLITGVPGTGAGTGGDLGQGFPGTEVPWDWGSLGLGVPGTGAPWVWGSRGLRGPGDWMVPGTGVLGTMHLNSFEFSRQKLFPGDQGSSAFSGKK